MLTCLQFDLTSSYISIQQNDVAILMSPIKFNTKTLKTTIVQHLGRNKVTSIK